MRRLLLAVLMVTIPVSAQTGEPGPLSGPRVASPAPRVTLVERDFEGRLRRLEASPEEAALSRLNLAEATRAKADAVLAARAAVVDKIVGGNIELLLRLSTSGQADRLEQVQLAGEAFDALRPLRERGPLLKELRDALPGAEAAELSRLVTEYRKALREEISADARAKGERLGPRQAAARAYQSLLGDEIRRSYDRQIACGTAMLERAIGRLNLTPEQDTTIRNMVLDFVQKTMGKATESQKRDLFLGILVHLDARQRRELIRMVIQGG
jgi:hypothetical protein